MIIAVNTKALLSGHTEGNAVFIYEVFTRITAQHPDHEFIFIADRPFDERLIKGKNVKGMVVGPVARHPLFLKYWNDIKVPSALTKYKADVLVSCDGICSLRTKIPQCLVVQDLGFLEHPSFIKRSHVRYYKKNIPKSLGKAVAVATVSEFLKNGIIGQYKTAAGKIDVIYNGVNEVFQPSGPEEKANTKNKYTEGREYFVFTGGIDPGKNLMNLLKAFSVFKKRQKTNMKLVLAGKLAENYGSFAESLRSYKYREDVVMTGDVEESELVKITAAAYGMVYPSLLDGFAVPVVEAMKCNVPVITAADSSGQEIAKDAALYSDANDIGSIADKMMLLYKDENLRNELITKGFAVAREYSWGRTADLLWQSILKAVN